MQFKDLKPGSQVYILDQNNLELSLGKVTNNSFPYRDPKMSKSGNYNNTLNDPMVVDLTIEYKGTSATYTMSDTSQITYTNNLILATIPQVLTPIIENIKVKAAQALDKDYLDKQQKILDRSTKLLVELDPAFKQQQEYENRFNRVESSVTEVKDMLSQILKKLDK